MSTFASVPILRVWRRLGGGELRHGRGQAFWRDGRGYNVALDPEQGVWYDYAASMGGGLLDLLETALRSDRRGALAWLEAQGFIEARTPVAEAERRILVLKREIAGRTARDILAWFRARCERLETDKASLFKPASFKVHRQAILAARELTKLQTGDAATVARAFFDYRRSLPEDAVHLVELGRKWGVADRRTAANCVSLLVQAYNREGTDAK